MKNNIFSSKRILRNRSTNGVSKKEAETPEYMRRQKFSEEKIKELQKKLDGWKREHKKT